MSFNRVILDIETNNLLEPMLDFTKRPLQLKESSSIWCTSLRCVDTNLHKMLIPPEILDNIEYYKNLASPEHLEAYNKLDVYPLTKKDLEEHLKDSTELIAHSGIKFDFPALKLFKLLDYEVGYPALNGINSEFKTKTHIYGRDIKITDTLLWSKMTNPDRYAHGLEYFGNLFGNKKIHFKDFHEFSIEMVVYCAQDTNVNRDVYNLIEEEKDGYEGWELPYLMEAKLADMSLKQEMFGFDYDMESSEKCKEDLESLLQERDNLVTPAIPPRKLNKTETKYFTPPKIKFSVSANRMSSHMSNFIDKIGADFNPISNTYTYEDEDYDLYYEGCVQKNIKATIKDLMHIKGYLIQLGWVPTEMNNRDLVRDSNKQLRTPDKFEKSLDNYIEETFNGPFREIRLMELELPEETTPEEFKEIFTSKFESNPKRSIYIPTSPPLKVGVDKELCPGLLAIMDTAPFAKDVAEYFTYSHRRNSISGNVDLETGESGSGFESYVREDGRISTPVDTMGASTSRMTHKVVNEC